ncbi:MAG TPA: thioredoxin domain-containing protein [Bryobacteraceae bacterium]|jgi:protein-disulfide isomerase|nr:thioredoxin domain-containing protein [Bryobacteraceae bacterium]
MRIAILFAATVSLFAQGVKAPEKSAFDKATLEAYLRNVELWNPAVEVKIDNAKPSAEMPGLFEVGVHLSYKGASQDLRYFLSKDGKKIMKGDVYDVNQSPFQANLDKLKTAARPSFGPAAAPVTMVVFSDFQCPVCKEEATVLRQNVAAAFKDKVRVVFTDFPLEQIHPWAKQAAIAGRCVYKQDAAKFWDYFDWVYENQQNIGLDNFSSKFQTFAGDKGLDGMALGACVANKAAEQEVAAEMEEGRSLQIQATPTIFLNGRKLEGGVPWQTLETLINIELDHQAKMAEADKCCEVGIPKVVKQ